MRRSLPVVVAVSSLFLAVLSFAEYGGFPLPAGPQDEGLPYTRSARPAARNAIGKTLVFFPGSRYAYAYGYRTRLDGEDLLDDSAIEKNGVLHVPLTFAPIIFLREKDIVADKAPSYLADKFVHTLALRPGLSFEGPRYDETFQHEGQTYVALEELAGLAGKPIVRGSRGLVVIGEANPAWFKDPEMTDCVVTLFDTPETLADPDIAARYVPLLKRQGRWTKWVKHTPEQLKLLEGPETEWPMVPYEEFDFEGFNARLLGSRVPAPGVYPRILFSPEDLPMIRRRLKTDELMAYSYAEMQTLLKRTWLSPENDDGRLFDRLASGKPIALEEIPEGCRKRGVPLPFGTLLGHRAGIYSSHLPYIGHCLVALAFQAMVEEDELLGKKTAAAIVTWCELMERGVDKLNAMSDSEYGVDHAMANGAETAYRMMCGADHMDLPYLMDFGGVYMNAGQKDAVRRLIAKATYGRAESHCAGSVRWEENNHCTWHTTIFLSQMAIEGLEGYDPETLPRAIRTIRAFSEFGIDDRGVVFESNGKSGAGFMNIMMNMVAVARRGTNFFGHPHWRKLPYAQTMCSSPAGSLTVTSGTYAGKSLGGNVLMFLKSFYPEDRCLDWLLTTHFTHFAAGVELAPEAVAARLDQLFKKQDRTRLPIFTSPCSQRCTVYDITYEDIKRDALELPLFFQSTTHGIFSAYSGGDEDAAWLNFLVHDNHYVGAGHHHNDAGMFTFSANGVNWIHEARFNYYLGDLHNLVLVDGKSCPARPGAKGEYLGASDSPDLAQGSGDMTYAYSWRWNTQTILWDEASWWEPGPVADQNYEFEPHPDVIAAFKGTQRYKMRHWWPSYVFSNWMPTSRAPFNPMQKVWRTAGLVRGAHSYGVIADELQKDDKSRHYQWTACPGTGVWKSNYTPAGGRLPAGQGVLGYDSELNPSRYDNARPATLASKAAGAQLLVCALNVKQLNPEKDAPIDVITREGPFDERGKKKQYYDNVVINHYGEEASFRVLLIPFRKGEALPVIAYDAGTDAATISWADQKDKLRFIKEKDRVRFELERQAR